MFFILFFDLSVQILAIAFFSIVMVILVYYALRKILTIVSGIQSNDQDQSISSQTSSSTTNPNISTSSLPIYPRFVFWYRRCRRFRRRRGKYRW